MLLQRLSEYADRLGLPPPMYQSLSIRYVIQLDWAGGYRNLIDRATQESKRGIAHLVPSLRRSVNVKPTLLADNGEYVLGRSRETSRPERVGRQHTAFCELVNACAAATGESAVQAVAAFLATDLATLPLPDDFDPSANLMFEVDGVFPVDLDAVRAYWAQVAGVSDGAEPMQCLVCGQMRPPVARLFIPIKGIPGGQPTGMALISANAAAFESYGLEASLIAPTCEDCGQRFGNALNDLIAQPQTHLYVLPLVYIFWAREPAPFALGTLLSSAEDAEVRRFLTAAWRATPEGARLATAPFYAASLSASGARVVVRDWIETTLGEAQRHLTRYFRLQRIRDAYTGEPRWFALWELVRATTNKKSKKEEPSAQVIQALLHLALYGGPLPAWLLYQAVRRTRAEQGVSAAQAALIKTVLLTWHQESAEASSSAQKGEDTTMTETHDLAELDRNNRAPAYLCGRLLAELEALQRAALGDISATVVDRYFGTASSAPASVFGRLLRGAQPHLGKLRREREGTYRAIDARLQEILSGLPSFPAMLKLRDQGLFALGYYHQKADNTRARKARQAERRGINTNDEDDSGEAASA